MSRRLEPLIPKWALIFAIVLGLAIPLVRSKKSSAPNVSHEFWIVETDPNAGTLVGRDHVEEGDPSVRAWCYAMGYQSEGKPFAVGLSLYRTRGLYTKIMIPDEQKWEYASDVLPDAEYFRIAYAARTWAETVPCLRRYMGPTNSLDMTRTGTWVLDPIGIFASILIDAAAVCLVIRWIQNTIFDRRIKHRRLRLEAGQCPVCGYEIGSPDSTVCPECGRPLPPRDPAPSA